MATTNHERVGKAMDLLRDGLRPFVERELKAQYGKYWITQVTAGWRHDLSWPEDQDEPHLDVALVLRLMWEQWNEVFRRTLGHAERSLVSELRDVRNKWAHQEPFSSDDTYRALDSTARLLTAVSAPEAEEVEQHEDGAAARPLRRAGPRREAQDAPAPPSRARPRPASSPGARWSPRTTTWPAAATSRPSSPPTCGRSTWARAPTSTATRSSSSAAPTSPRACSQLLVGAVRRLGGARRRPGRPAPDQLRRRQDPLHAGALPPLLRRATGRAGRHRRRAAGSRRHAAAPPVQRVVLVGNKHLPRQPRHQARRHRGAHPVGRAGLAAGRPGRPSTASRADDERATSPGDALRELFNDYGPCLVLIDEWVAYARQLHDDERPAGRQLRDPVHLRPGPHRVGQAGRQLPAGHQPARLRHLRLAPRPGRRHRGRRPARARGPGPAAERGRPRRVLLAAGQRRGGLRDRAAPPLRAARRTRPSSRTATWSPAPSPTSTATQHAGVPARVPRRRLREAHPGRLPHPPRGLRPPLHRLVHPAEVPAHPRRAAPDGRRHPQPVGEGRPQPADPAGQHPHRRHARPVRADPLPLGQLGAGHREGRGRPQLAAPARSTARCPTWASSPPAAAWPAPSTWAPRPPSPPPTAASRTGASSSAA